MNAEPYRPQAFIDCPECGGTSFAFSSGRFPEGDIWYECIQVHRVTLAHYLASSPDGRPGALPANTAGAAATADLETAAETPATPVEHATASPVVPHPAA